MSGEFDKYTQSIFNQVDRIYSFTLVNCDGEEILKQVDPRYSQEPVFTHPKASFSDAFIKLTKQAELFNPVDNGGEISSLNSIVTYFKTLQLIQIKFSEANTRTGREDNYYLSILAKRECHTGFVIALFQNEFIPYILQQIK